MRGVTGFELLIVTQHWGVNRCVRVVYIAWHAGVEWDACCELLMYIKVRMVRLYD